MDTAKRKKYQVCIFDLDGTLVNTLADMAFAANRALTGLGLPPCPEDDYRYKVGNGMRLLCQRALPEEVRDDQRILEEMIRAYDSYYSAHCCDRSRAYPGIPELIRDLRQEGVLLAVISNKPDDQTRTVMRTLFQYREDRNDSTDPAPLQKERSVRGENDFFYVQGQRAEVAKKPDPEALLDCIRKSGLPKEVCIYVGDSNVDVEFAARAGIPCIGAAWGFRGRRELEEAGAAFVAGSAADVFAYVTGINEQAKS